MIELHTPSGIIYIDPSTITNDELSALGLTRSWADEQLAEDIEQTTCEEYLAHSADVIILPEMWFLMRALAKKLGYMIN